ncbi:NRPS [Knufia obscura]|uniref:NRPS n=1 Tax=Knufia obscura TaxID=1635080 RepID=A0ABR0R976_9EURO|nr:NRPS [Knufia obscura]
MGMQKEPLSEAQGEQLSGPWPTTLHDLLSEAEEKYSSRTAVTCLHQDGDRYTAISGSTSSPYLKWTHAELARASTAFAVALVAAGVRSGMRIVAFLPNCIEFHIAFKAAVKLNCPFAPLNPRTVGNAEEVRNVFDVVGPSVVIAENTTTAKKLTTSSSESLQTLNLRLIADSSHDEEAPDSWQSFGDFLQAPIHEQVPNDLEITRTEDDVVLVLMTSGTTSLPKGCPHTNRSYTANLRANTWTQLFDKTRTVCAHLPPSHLFGLSQIYMSLISGVPVIHPSSYFDAGSTLKALRDEQCSDLAGVPSMLTSLLSHPDLGKTNTTCLKHVVVAGATVTTEELKSFQDALGAQKVCQSYGMTEAAPAAGRRYDELPTYVTEELTSGITLPGVKIRVCDPETGKVVPRGQAGECHIGGNVVITKYWYGSTKREDSTLYTDELGAWVKTGDKAIMTEHGEISIIGRYKHLIIHGGENISPKAIEDLLFRDFDLAADVVGVPDEVAGEVPVAVIKKKEGQEVEEAVVTEDLVKNLGPSFALESIIDTNKLGLEDFPKTSTGKVQKNELQEQVVQYLENESQQQRSPLQNGQRDVGELTQVLIRLWTRLLGVSEGTITPDSPIDVWADSLTLGRFPRLLQKETGQSLRVQELMDNATPSAQATLLASGDSLGKPQNHQPFPPSEDPPTPEEMIHAQGDNVRAQHTIDVCRATLKPLGLDWEDVQDVLPMYSFQEHYLRKRRPQSNNHRHAWVCSRTNLQNARRAIEGTLSRHDMLRTMAVRLDDGTCLHVVVRPSRKWYDQCITILDSVDTAESLKRLAWNDPEIDHACIPGPLFRILLTHIRDEECTAMVYIGQHSAFDGISLPFFIEDLDVLLGDPEATPPSSPVQYKAYAYHHYNLRTSQSARRAVAFHVQRLQGLRSKRSALFPTQRAPEWFKGSSEGWTDQSTGQLGPARKPAGPNSGQGAEGLSETCNLEGIQHLKSVHGIEASTVVKTALVLLNTRHTGRPFALFAQLQAARSWPFLEEWQNALMPPAMNIAGPTFQAAVISVDAAPQCTVLELLSRIQKEQELLNKHAHAPFGDIAAALGEDGETMIEVQRRQTFNWLPGTSEAELKNLRKVQQVSRTDVGILWNCVQLKNEQVKVAPSWDDAQLTLEEMEAMLKEIVGIAESIVKEKNWESKICDL